jgi:hypothetical protein
VFDNEHVTANRIRPRISASDLVAAAARLFGTVVLDVADLTTCPAVYLPRLEAFATIDGDELGADDGTLIDLLDGVPARDLIAEYGTAGKAAAALNARVRQAWAA